MQDAAWYECERAIGDREPQRTFMLTVDSDLQDQQLRRVFAIPWTAFQNSNRTRPGLPGIGSPRVYVENPNSRSRHMLANAPAVASALLEVALRAEEGK